MKYTLEYLTPDNIKQLIDDGPHEPAVTMYVPTAVNAAPPQITENQIRFKNLISQAAVELEQHSNDNKLSGQLRELQQAAHDDADFWKQQTAGMLLCATPGMVRLFHLPYDTEEYVSVGSTFYLAPVLSILNDAQDYYVLTVQQHGPQLFKGNMYGLQATGLELPYDTGAALNIDENNQKSENQGSASGSSMNTGWYNGRGGARNPQENDRMMFFRMIDNAVNKYIHADTPLILAGIDAEIAEYRSMSKYPRLLESFISGSHTNAKPTDLAAEASAIIQKEVIDPAHAAAIEDYELMHGANPGRAAADKATISQAVEQGRVDKLLVRMTRTTTDVVRDTLEAAKRITFPEPELSKSLNELAIKVWQMSGTVIGLAANEMPNGAAMLARMRY